MMILKSKAKKEPKTLVSVRLPASLAEDLKMWAEQEQMTISGFMTDLLVYALEQLELEKRKGVKK